jgi:hypothetical protein
MHIPRRIADTINLLSIIASRPGVCLFHFEQFLNISREMTPAALSRLQMKVRNASLAATSIGVHRAVRVDPDQI